MIALLAGLALAADPPADWVTDLVAGHHLSTEQEAAVRAVVGKNTRMGTGLPVSQHPMTLQQCEERREGIPLPPSGRCPAYMVPLYDPATQTADQATTCIDQFEFPGLPCRYPIVWVRAREAAQLCSAMGKRLCDAHEWEGACAGALGPADYRFDLSNGRSANAAHTAMRQAHNTAAEPHKSWATGDTKPAAGVCAQGSTKSPSCDGSDPLKCGSNTYPTGAIPGCVSPLGVYDQHGNAAEHMNLPLSPAQLSSTGTALGVTEMKGSWFIFDSYAAHEDWCQWRAPFWHGTEVMAADSHRNYHLGFRCCAEVSP